MNSNVVGVDGRHGSRTMRAAAGTGVSPIRCQSVVSPLSVRRCQCAAWCVPMRKLPRQLLRGLKSKGKPPSRTVERSSRNARRRRLDGLSPAQPKPGSPRCPIPGVTRIPGQGSNRRSGPLNRGPSKKIFVARLWHPAAPGRPNPFLNRASRPPCELNHLVTALRLVANRLHIGGNLCAGKESTGSTVFRSPLPWTSTAVRREVDDDQ
jgi:hypothetical protein